MTTATIEREKKVVKIDNIADLLFQQVEKPKNILKIKVINVYENAYRINIYSEHFDENLRLNKIKISHSYFCKLIDDKLIIRLGA